MEILSHELQKDGLVIATVELTNAEKFDLTQQACKLFCTEFFSEADSQKERMTIENLCSHVGEEYVSAMVASYAMGFTSHCIAEQLGVIATVAPLCVAQTNILDKATFTFTATIAPKPRCDLSTYSPIVIVAKNSQQQEELLRMKEACTTDKADTPCAALCDAAENVLIGRLAEAVPIMNIEAMRDSLLDDIYRQARWRGKTLEEFLQAQRLDEGLLSMMLHERAKNALERELALDALFLNLNYTLTREDRMRAAQSLVVEYEGNILEHFKSRGMSAIVEQTAGQMRARSWLIETCRILIEQ